MEKTDGTYPAKTIIAVGVQVKILVTMQPVDGYTMEDVDFFIEAGCRSSHIVTINKASATKVDENSYIVVVDTKETGVGKIKLRLTARIPDGDLPAGYRVEVAEVETGLEAMRLL